MRATLFPPRIVGTAANVASTTTSSASAAFGSTTNIIMISSSAAVQFRVGDGTPTAVTTDTLLPANTVVYLSVNPSQKLAVIGTATVSVTEMNAG